MHIENVRSQLIPIFADLLIRFPHENDHNYELRVGHLASLLDAPLIRPSFLSRLVRPPQSSYTPLCSLHKPLNASAVHQLFTLVALEVGVRINSLIVSGRAKVGCDAWDRCILNLRSLHGIWLPPNVLQKTFGMSLQVAEDSSIDTDYMTKWSFQSDGCEACMLARIAGDLNTLMDLRMVVKSRMFSRVVQKNGEPRLWTWIEAWLKCWQNRLSKTNMLNEIELNMELNELRVTRLKDLRKDIMKEKRRQREMRRGNDEKHNHQKRKRMRSDKNDFDHNLMAAEENFEEERRWNKPETSTRTPEFVHQSSLGCHPYDSELEGAHALPQDPPDFSEAERNDEADVVVEETAQNTEAETIHVYMSLISTPFLPGMDTKQHKRAESVLSASFAQRMSPVSPVSPGRAESEALPAYYRPDIRPSNNPYIHKAAANYSASIYSTDDPSHPEYIGRSKQQLKPRRGHANGHMSAPQVDSWITTSVASSTQNLLDAKEHKSPTEMRQRFSSMTFSTIKEEDETSTASPMRRAKTVSTHHESTRSEIRRGDTQAKPCLVLKQPTQIQRSSSDRRLKSSPRQKSTKHTHVRPGASSPVSPLSPRIKRYHGREDRKLRSQGLSTSTAGSRHRSSNLDRALRKADDDRTRERIEGERRAREEKMEGTSFWGWVG